MTATQAAFQRQPVRIVALGTSLTARATWPQALQAALTSRGHDAVVETVAQPGMGSAWGLAQIDRVIAAAPDVVLVEFAVNDAALWRRVSLARSRATMGSILGTLRRHLPDVCLAAMAMSPVSGLRGWLRPRLAGYEDAHLRDALAFQAMPIDFRPDWQRISATERRRIIPDGVHPEPEATTRVMLPRLLASLEHMPCFHSTSGLRTAS